MRKLLNEIKNLITIDLTIKEDLKLSNTLTSRF